MFTTILYNHEPVDQGRDIIFIVFSHCIKLKVLMYFDLFNLFSYSLIYIWYLAHITFHKL